jgi:nitric-oxide synthase, brain
LSRASNAPPFDQLFRVEILIDKPNIFGVTKEWIKDSHFPELTLRSALTKYLNITSTVSQKMLKHLSTQTSNEKEKETLEMLSSDHLKYDAWCSSSTYPNLLNVLDQFPSLRPNASLLITQLPKLQPRFYSISSSPKCIQDQIHMTVGIVEYVEPKTNEIIQGVCSKWLDKIEKGQLVPSFIRVALNFRMPDDKTCPIVMIGAGTGIAPFRSFWQERQIEKNMMPIPKGINGTKWGEMYLYFGCRKVGIDDLYKNELDKMVSENVITKLYIAYSRQAKKVLFF